MSALFPNVPSLIAGVPAVLRRAGDLADAQETLAGAMSDVSTSVAAQRWGVFSQGGALLLEPDSIGAFEYGGEYRIASFPIEGGSFENYDKVALPFDIRVMMTKGGTLAERTQFLTAVDTLRESLDLLNFVSPERVYLNVNISRIGMVRNSGNGAGLLSVEVSLQEIRVTAQAQFSKSPAQMTTPAPATPAPKPPGTAKTVKAPAAARRVNQGVVQPKPTYVAPGVQLKSVGGGPKYFVYDKPPGK